MSVLVIMTVSFPACANTMCRKLSLRNMFTTSSNGTSFCNCMASSNSDDKSAESLSCAPVKQPIWVAAPLSERKGSVMRETRSIRSYRENFSTSQ